MFELIDHALVRDGRVGAEATSELHITARADSDAVAALGEQIRAAVLCPLSEVVAAWRGSDVYARFRHLDTRRQTEQSRLQELDDQANSLAGEILATFTSDASPDSLERKRENALAQVARIRDRLEALESMVAEARKAAEQTLRLDLAKRIAQLRGSFREELTAAIETFTQALAAYAEVHISYGCVHATTDRKAIDDITALVWPEELPALAAVQPAPVPPPPVPAGEAFHIGANYDHSVDLFSE